MQVIKREPPDQLAAAGIDIGNLQAAGEVIVRYLNAAGSILVKDVAAKEGRIDIQDISAGGPRKP